MSAIEFCNIGSVLLVNGINNALFSGRKALVRFKQLRADALVIEGVIHVFIGKISDRSYFRIVDKSLNFRVWLDGDIIKICKQMIIYKPGNLWRQDYCLIQLQKRLMIKSPWCGSYSQFFAAGKRLNKST